MWEDILKEEAGELLPLLDKLTKLLETRIREMEGVMRDSEEEDEAYFLAEDILLFAERANGTGDMPRLWSNRKNYRNVIKLIDEKYAELVKMLM